MSKDESNVMAQAVFLAQLEAAKSKCDCRTCQILRKATEAMTAQFMQPPQTEIVEVK